MHLNYLHLSGPEDYDLIKGELDSVGLVEKLKEISENGIIILQFSLYLIVLFFYEYVLNIINFFHQLIKSRLCHHF